MIPITIDIISGLVILLVAFLAEKAAEKYKKRLWMVFVALVLLQMGFMVSLRIHDQREATARAKENAEQKRQITELQQEVLDMKTREEDTNKVVHQGQQITLQNTTDPALVKLLTAQHTNSFDPLKEKTLALSNKLYDFARSREILSEALRDTDGDAEEVKKQKSKQREAFRKETITLFEREYKEEADDIMKKFSTKGVSIHASLTDEGAAESGAPPFQLSTDLRMMANQIDSTGHLVH